MSSSEERQKSLGCPNASIIAKVGAITGENQYGSLIVVGLTKGDVRYIRCHRTLKLLPHTRRHDPLPISPCEFAFFHTPAPTAFDIPIPIPTAAPTTIRPMSILATNFCFLLNPLSGLHPPFLRCVMDNLLCFWLLHGHTSCSLWFLDTSEDGKIDDPASRSCSWIRM